MMHPLEALRRGIHVQKEVSTVVGKKPEILSWGAPTIYGSVANN